MTSNNEGNRSEELMDLTWLANEQMPEAVWERLSALLSQAQPKVGDGLPLASGSTGLAGPQLSDGRTLGLDQEITNGT